MKLSEAEWKIMNALWEGHPATAREVKERTESQAGWAYTTVKTMLNRLEEKGAVGASMRANTRLYTPCIDRRQARRSALRAMLDSAFDGALGPLMQFMLTDDAIKPGDKAELERLLKEHARGKGKPK